MKNNKKRIIPVLFIVLLIVLYFVFIKGSGNENVYTVSGIVEAREVDIAPIIAGRINAIYADEGYSVTKGDLLLQMDDRKLEIQVNRAEAALNASQEQLKDIEAGARPEEIAVAEATYEAARATYRKAFNDKKRAEELFKEEAASRDFLEKAELNLETAEKNMERAEEQLRLLKAGSRKNLIESVRFKVQEAKKAVDELNLLKTDSRTFSPIDGVVTVRSAERGEVIAAGTTVLTVIDPTDCYVRIYLTEKILGNVRIGQKVEIISDSFPDKPITGTITFISDQAEFTPRNIQTKEERVKLVFQAKVNFENKNLVLKPGMPVDVSIELSRPKEKQ